MTALRYISHPNVVQDPSVAVPQWRLSDEGERRARAMLGASWIADIGRVISSAETKARMTADILAEHLNLRVEVRPESGETDRSTTGYVSEARHEELVERFFANPAAGADGWETAVAAQRRVVAALSDVLTEQPGDRSDIAVIGHGGVGTLLRCHLVGLEINRSHDQPGQGHYWSLDRATGSVMHGWRPVDE